MTGPTVADIATIVAEHQPMQLRDTVRCFSRTCETSWATLDGHWTHVAELIAPVIEDAQVDAAIDTTARAVIWDLVRDQAGDADLWGTYPDIGEGDFATIVHRAEQLAHDLAPSNAARLAAYDLLHDRTDADGGES